MARSSLLGKSALLLVRQPEKKFKDLGGLFLVGYLTTKVEPILYGCS